MRLSHADFDLLQRTICEIYQLRTLPEFREAICTILLRAINADCFAWQHCTIGTPPAMIDYFESDSRSTPEIRERWVNTMHLHPFTGYFIKTKDRSPLKLSDFVSQREIDNSPHLREGLRPVQCRYQLAAATFIPEKGIVGGLNFLRERRDFTERDRTILTLLRPHVVQARENAERVSALIESGTIRDEEDCNDRVAELTPRESEVGQWLAVGKTNWEIAILLDASPRTIDKHVEHILAKLGVENRTAAALILRNAKVPEARL